MRPPSAFRSALLAAPLAAALAAPAAAQPMQTDAAPAAGTLRAEAGTRAAELALDVRPRVLSPVDGCPGHVDPAAPDAVVEWDGGDLRVGARAAFDATLLVYTPGGEWACNDDAEGTQPAVQIRGAAAGRYAVWVGSFSPSPDAPAATLSAGAPPPRPVLDADAAPAAGTIEAAGGFEAARGGIEVNVEAGGRDAAADLDVPAGAAACAGYVDAGRPTAAVRYAAEGGTGALVIGAYAFDADLTLVVQGPDGDVLCNDDYDGTDPTVVVEDAQSGRYAVWVGTFWAAVEPVGATLVLSETAPEFYDVIGDGEVFDEPFDDFGAPYSEGAYAPLDLDAAPAARLTLGDDGPVSAALSVRPSIPNPVQGDACAGFVEPAPSAGVTLDGGGPVALTASSEADLTLVVRTPSGAWFCSDDADGLDPGVQVDVPEGGTYSVWVGAFGDGSEPVAAELRAERGELFVSDAEPSLFDTDFDAAARQSDGAYDGADIGGAAGLALDVGGEAAVVAGGPVLNPVEGEACAGFLSERPTATVRVSDPFEVEITASSEADLTLVVQTPSGAWLCSDDADGTDPAVLLAAPELGPHSVWVGTFSRRSAPPEATLRARYAEPPPPPAPPPPPGRN